MALSNRSEGANLPTTDPRLDQLSRANCFETMPGGTSEFIENVDLRAVIQRPLAGSAMSGAQILDLLTRTARRD